MEMTGEEIGMEEMHARRIGAFTREDRGKREEIERREKRKGQRGEIGEKTTYINDMMNGGRGLSTIPNRHRNAQELQGDCPAAGDREGGGGKRGGRASNRSTPTRRAHRIAREPGFPSGTSAMAEERDIPGRRIIL